MNHQKVLWWERAYKRIEKIPFTILPILWVIFSTLMILVNALPDRLVKSHIAAGVLETVAEGDHPKILFSEQSALDNFTDRIMLQQSQRTSSWNSITALFTEKDLWEGIEAQSLHNPLFAAFSNQGYSRYWHGYTIFLKPLLAVFSYQTIRQLSFLALIGLIISAFNAVKKSSNLYTAVSLLVSLVIVNVMIVPMSLVFSPVFYITLISVVVVAKSQKLKDGKDRVLFFLIVGSVTNYLDFLTVPILTLCIPLVLLIFFDTRVSSYSQLRRWGLVFTPSIGWVCGYASTWFIKWVLSSMVTGRNVIADAILNILVRSDTGGINEAHGIHFDRFETIRMNYAFAFTDETYAILFAVLVGTAFILMFQIITGRIQARFDAYRILNGLPILLVAFAPIAWYMVLLNHSTIHMQFYAYKNVCITIFAVLVFISLSMRITIIRKEFDTSNDAGERKLYVS